MSAIDPFASATEGANLNFDDVMDEGNFSLKIPNITQPEVEPGDYHFKTLGITKGSKEKDGKTIETYSLRNVILGKVGNKPGDSYMGIQLFSNFEYTNAAVWRIVTLCKALNVPVDSEGEFEFNKGNIIGKTYIATVKKTESKKEPGVFYTNINKEKPGDAATDEFDIVYEASK